MRWTLALAVLWSAGAALADGNHGHHAHQPDSASVPPLTRGGHKAPARAGASPTEGPVAVGNLGDGPQQTKPVELFTPKSVLRRGEWIASGAVLSFQDIRFIVGSPPE